MPPLLFLLLNFAVTVIARVNFDCPSYVNQKNGVFPTGASGVNTFPHDYSCTIQFDIPDGYIVIFEASAVMDNWSGEQFTITDTMNKNYEISSIGETVYAPASSAKVQITNGDGFAGYFVKWEYVHIASYKIVKESQAWPVSMAIPAKRSLLFTAMDGSTNLMLVTTSMGKYNGIQVYSGDSLDGMYLGKLSDLVSDGILTSPSTFLTLTTFGSDDTSQNGYVLGMDPVSVKAFSSFGAVNLDDTQYGTVQKNSAVTFFSQGGNYDIVSLAADGNTEVQVMAMTPIQNCNYQFCTSVLVYKGQNFDNYMPQQVLAHVFTVSASSSSASLSFSTKSSWNTAYDGRKGRVISPELWAPNVKNEITTRIDANGWMTFRHNGQRIRVGSGVSLRVTVGDEFHSTPYYYTRSGDNTTVISTNGTYIEVAYTTGPSSASDFILNFEMESPFPVSTTTRLTTKSSTTTRTSTTTAPNFPTTQSPVNPGKPTAGSVTKTPLGTTTKVSVRGSGHLIITILVIFMFARFDLI